MATAEPLAEAVRTGGLKVRAALAALFGDIELAEESFAEACARAAALAEPPCDPLSWLYVVGRRAAVDELRRRKVASRDGREPSEAADFVPEERMLIPDDRLRLIFACCHPALEDVSRACLILNSVCGLPSRDVAAAFLTEPGAMAQRLSRAKRKVREAGISFSLPTPANWKQRLAAVLTAVEIGYARAQGDAAGTGSHAGLVRQMLELTALLAELLPEETEILALAALLRFSEARRPARLDESGTLVPLADQDPVRFDRRLASEGLRMLLMARRSDPTRRLLLAEVQALWTLRRSEAPPPWPQVLALYTDMLSLAATPFVRLNRLVALAEVHGPRAALADLDELSGMEGYGPYHALRADLLRRLDRPEADEAYALAMSLAEGEAELRFLAGRRALVQAPGQPPR